MRKALSVNNVFLTALLYPASYTAVIMGPSTSLFSRARPGKSVPKRARGFLSLPGELRNEVYQYYFESEVHCEVAAKGSHFNERKTRTVKLWAGAFQSNAKIFKYDAEKKEELPLTIRVSRLLGHYRIVKGLQTNWFGSLFAINLICKQVHSETLPFLYSKTLFVFDASSRLTNFVQVVSSSKLQHITKLQIHYATYGSPRMEVNRIWQDKHTKSWIRACKATAKKLVGLGELTIWVRVQDSPPRFSLHEPWVLPLLQFRRLSVNPQTAEEASGLDVAKRLGSKLGTVNINFRTVWSGWTFNGNQELAKASEELHGLFGDAISSAILGAKEEAAMRALNKAWNKKHAGWQHHLGFIQTEY